LLRNFGNRCDRSLTDSLSEWIVSNDFSLIARRKAVFALKRLTQLRQFLSDRDACAAVRPDAKDDLASWLDLLADRSICLKFLEKNGSSPDSLSVVKVRT
jgi:hypothetical protein